MSDEPAQKLSLVARIACVFASLGIGALWFWFAFMGGESPEIGELRTIQERPVAVNGTIVKYRFQRASGHNGNFDKIDYFFKVDGKSFRGTANGSGAEGGPVLITYYAKNPSIHCVGDPWANIKARKEHGSTFTFVGAALAFAFAGPLLALGLNGNQKVF